VKFAVGARMILRVEPGRIIVSPGRVQASGRGQWQPSIEPARAQVLAPPLLGHWAPPFQGCLQRAQCERQGPPGAPPLRRGQPGQEPGNTRPHQCLGTPWKDWTAPPTTEPTVTRTPAWLEPGCDLGRLAALTPLEHPGEAPPQTPRPPLPCQHVYLAPCFLSVASSTRNPQPTTAQPSSFSALSPILLSAFAVSLVIFICVPPVARHETKGGQLPPLPPKERRGRRSVSSIDHLSFPPSSAAPPYLSILCPPDSPSLPPSQSYQLHLPRVAGHLSHLHSPSASSRPRQHTYPPPSSISSLEP